MSVVTDAAFKLSVWAYGHFYKRTFEKRNLVKLEKKDESGTGLDLQAN